MLGKIYTKSRIGYEGQERPLTSTEAARVKYDFDAEEAYYSSNKELRPKSEEARQLITELRTQVDNLDRNAEGYMENRGGLRAYLCAVEHKRECITYEQVRRGITYEVENVEHGMFVEANYN